MPKLGLGLSLPQTRVAGGFTPKKISGLSLWLKSDAGVTLSGSDVTAWADQSGNGNNASSSIGTRPTLVSNTLNSKPVLRFDGTGQQMAITASIGGTEYSIFIVCKNNDNTNGSMFLWSTDENYVKYIGSITSEGYNADARNKFVLSEADAGSGGEGSVLAWSSTAVNNNYFIGTATQNGGGKAYSNGSGGTDSLGTFEASNTFDLIGGYGSGYELDGDVAEIIAYNRVLTTPERQQVEAYLMNKYALFPASGLSLWLKSDAGTTTEAEQFISQIIVSGAGTTTSNGTYTRASGGTTGFTGPNGNTINFGIKEAGGFVFQIYDATFGDTTYSITIANDEIISINLSNGESPAPTATTSLTATGNTIVTAWADQSGNGNNASSIFPPALVSNILNSKPVLRFNGAWQQMALTSSIGGTEYSIFIVCKNNDNTNGSMFFWTTEENFGRYIGVLTDVGYNADARNKFVLSEADAGGGGEGSVLAWSSASANNNFFIGTATQNGNGKAYLNGAGGTDSLGTFIESNTFDLIGGYGYGYELDGDVAEIIAYNRVLTTPERQQVEAYLNDKYEIY